MLTAKPEHRLDPDDVVIVAARRTPIGRFLGALAALTAVDLAEVALRAALGDAGLATDAPDRTGAGWPRVARVLLGCARQAGNGPNPARQVAVRAGLGDAVVAHTINMACASGLEAVIQGACLIRSGEADWVAAAGVEAMSRIPFLLDRYRTGYRMGSAEVIDAMVRDGYLCPLSGRLMGETAETLAGEYGITRTEQDEYALMSQERACAARDSGRFDDEIAPVPGPRAARPTGLAPESPQASAPNRASQPTASGSAMPVLSRDEHPRPDTTLDRLSALPPVFQSDGTVTAGNSSAITDGAAAVILTRALDAANAGLRPWARIAGWETAGVDPARMGISPVPAVRGLLAEAGLSLADCDLVELNEAFAAQVLAVDRELKFDRARLNPNGGAIALGHPTGCSGTRIVVTLLHEMRRRGVRRGLATLCASGGLGLAALFESV